MLKSPKSAASNSYIASPGWMFYNVHKPLICHHPFMLCMDGRRVGTVLECWQLKSQEYSVKHTVFSISMYYDCVLLLCNNHLAAGNTAAGWRNQPGGGEKEGSLILLTALITIICRCKARLEKWLPVSHFCKFHLSKQPFFGARGEYFWFYRNCSARPGSIWRYPHFRANKILWKFSSYSEGKKPDKWTMSELCTLNL